MGTRMTVDHKDRWNHAVSWEMNAGRSDSLKRGAVQLGGKRYFPAHIDAIPAQIMLPELPLHLSGVLSPVIWG
jgi:CTP-dependent riboflavin kinase